MEDKTEKIYVPSVPRYVMHSDLDPCTCQGNRHIAIAPNHRRDIAIMERIKHISSLKTKREMINHLASLYFTISSQLIEVEDGLN